MEQCRVQKPSLPNLFIHEFSESAIQHTYKMLLYSYLLRPNFLTVHLNLDLCRRLVFSRNSSSFNSNQFLINRARRRLDKEELFGHILLATLLPATNFKNGSSSVTQKPTSTMESFSHISPAVAGVRSPGGVHQNSPYSPKSCKENQPPNTNISSRTESLVRNTRPLRFTDARPQMSLPFRTLPFTGQQVHSPYMFNNMFRPGLVHGMFGMRPCRPLSPLNMSTRPTSSPVAPMPLFAVADGLARRSPSPEQQFSGADLLVTNLNESEPKEEITKKLASVFREHCKVFLLFH